MRDLTNQSLNVDMIGMPDETYLFNSMSRDDKQAVFNTGLFFNRQASGLRLKELEKDEHLSALLQPLAVFDSNSEADERFIAIAEGIKIPLYLFAYNMEMTQFYFEDPVLTADDF